ncbi:MAG: ArsR/SmtB family transcription factor [Candidatus Nanoarchaeia archaeon]
MAEKSFVLLSLKDDKAKNLSKALSNETCRKILDYLASKGDATETQISTDLKVPISTVHYNMKLLADNGLVSMDEYHYSEKGKEVIHYKMKNRYIVIAPEPEDEKSVMKKLRGMIPAAVILVIGTFLVGLFQVLFRSGAALKSGQMMASYSSEAAADSAAPLMTEAVGAAAKTTAAAAPVTASNPSVTLWFFLGGVFVLLCVLIWNFVKK